MSTEPSMRCSSQSPVATCSSRGCATPWSPAGQAYDCSHASHWAAFASTTGARQPGAPGHLGKELDPSLASASPKARHNSGTFLPPLFLVETNSDCVAAPGSSLLPPCGLALLHTCQRPGASSVRNAREMMLQPYTSLSTTMSRRELPCGTYHAGATTSTALWQHAHGA